MRTTATNHRSARSLAVLGLVTFLTLLASAVVPSREAPGQDRGQAKPVPSKTRSRVLAEYFPRQDLVVYAEFDGLERHEETWRKSAMYRMLTETPTGAMLDDLGTQLSAIVMSNSGDPTLKSLNLLTLFKHTANAGFALGIVRHPGDRKPSLVGVVVRNAAQGEVRRILGRLIDAGNRPGTNAEVVTKPGDRRVIVVRRQGGGPGFAWWSEGSDLVISLANPEGADLMIDALDGRQANATNHPTRAELARDVDGIEPIGVAFFDMAALPTLPPQAASLGLDRIKRLDYRWGFQGEALMTITRLVAPSPRTGMLALLDQPTFGVKDLPPLPGGLPGFSVLSIDLAKFYSALDELSKESAPRGRDPFREFESAFHNATGRDFRDGVLRPLGSKMVFYTVPTRINAPTNPLFGFARGLVHVPKSSLTIEVDDAETFGESLDAMMIAANRAMRRLPRGGLTNLGSPFVIEEAAPAAPAEIFVAPEPIPAPAPRPPEIQKRAIPKTEAPKRETRLRSSAPTLLLSGLLPGPPRQRDDDDSVDLRPASFQKLKGSEKGYTLAMPPDIVPMPAGMRPTILLGKNRVVLGATPEVAREALALEERNAGLPEGDRLNSGFEGLPDTLMFLHVTDTRESMLPEVIANLPSLVQMFGSGTFGESVLMPFAMLRGFRGGPFRSPGRLRFILTVDPENIPSPDQLRPYLSPSTFAMTVDDEGFQFLTRESFPALNPIALAPLAIAAALPAARASRTAAFRSQSVNNLKQIGLALHNFHDVHSAFPSDIKDANGKPLLSWRVAILQFIESAPLAQEFHLDEPWDSPHNKALIDKMPSIYRVPDSATAEPGMTFYRGFSGRSTLFDPSRGGGVRIADIFDGTSNTLAIVEAREAVIWTKPDSEIPFDADAKPGAGMDLISKLGGHFAGGFNALFMDGSVRFIKETVHPMVLRALITRDGGEVISSDAL